MDDVEISRLENFRRFGNPGNRMCNEGDYFRLPPRRLPHIRNWAEWRTWTNERLIVKIINSNGHGFGTGRELTNSALEKTPAFFKGQWFFEGLRVKDEYGGRTVTEFDNEVTRFEKKLIDENFFIFGIPRVSLKRMQRINADNPYNASSYANCNNVYWSRALGVDSSCGGTYDTLAAPNGNLNLNATGVSSETSTSNSSRSNTGHITGNKRNKQRDQKVWWRDPPCFSQLRIS